MTPLQIAYIGNFKPPHSTENHVLRALRWHGHEVTPIQEDERGAYEQANNKAPRFDLVFWTRTGWDWNRIYGHDEGTQMAFEDQLNMLVKCHEVRTPVIGFHLDRWFDLGRESQLDEPFFLCDIVFTADGGNQDRFLDRAINHQPILPGVSMFECELGRWRQDFASNLAFVGSWQGHYHTEHQHRHDLILWLKKNHRRDCAFWPKDGQPAVRGAELRDLYRSVGLLIGDSCFAGTDKSYGYISDRIPETLGRGGLLLHPRVPGVTDTIGGFVDGEHLLCWNAYDWGELAAKIDWALTHTREAEEIAYNGRAHVLAHHTYEVRVREVIEHVEQEGML